jgi:hypothetical protein
MTNSEPESNPPRQSAPQSPTTGIPLPLQLLVAAVLLPASAFLISWSLIIITNNLDVAYALGVSDNLVSGLVIGGSGLITGLVVALVSNRRAWGLVLPPAAGLMAGVAIYLGFVVFESGETVEIAGLGLITIGLGQVIAIVAATRLAGVALAGVFVATMAVDARSYAKSYAKYQRSYRSRDPRESSRNWLASSGRQSGGRSLSRHSKTASAAHRS